MAISMFQRLGGFAGSAAGPPVRAPGAPLDISRTFPGPEANPWASGFRFRRCAQRRPGGGGWSGRVGEADVGKRREVMGCLGWVVALAVGAGPIAAQSGPHGFAGGRWRRSVFHRPADPEGVSPFDRRRQTSRTFFLKTGHG